MFKPASLSRNLLVAAALVVIAPVAIYAQIPPAATHVKGDYIGDWQGTLDVGKSLRIIFKLAKDDGKPGVTMYSIDQTSQPFTASGVVFDGAAFKFNVDLIGGAYTGNFSTDGNTLTGTWTQAGKPFPLTLIRSTKETAWEIPAPPPPVKRMAVDADPSFDVATIKPNSGATSMQQLTINGRNFKTVASSLEDLISFAYDVQKKQIINAPNWVSSDRYDIAGTPDTEGAPNMVQLKGMVRKLLTERFKLTFHHDKRELSAFVLTVTKTGPKLKETESKGSLPGISFAPVAGGLNFSMINGTIADFAGVLQSLVLDRPVVDQTGLQGRYDLSVKFLPDETQFNGHPPVPAKNDAVEAQPDLFQAFQQRLGLKLDAQKTAVDVIAIDHIEHPTAN